MKTTTYMALKRLPFVFALVLLFVFYIAVSAHGTDENQTSFPLPHTQSAMVIDASQPGKPVQAQLWGSNMTNLAPASETVLHPQFISETKQLRISVIRWPGGNIASAYDWKQNVMIRPGRRQPLPDGVDIVRILGFVRQTGAELSVTVNFGTMTAQDAADLVAFLNGPVDSEWGARRAELGFPKPIGVRFFEIGNEEKQPHMWYNSWTAENPRKYFLGGDEERRGFYRNGANLDKDPVGAKGDFFKALGGPNQSYALRFPPIRDPRVYYFADDEAVLTCILAYRQNGVLPIIRDRCELWSQVEDLSIQDGKAKVYILDEQSGRLDFGDGVHGAMPSQGGYFLVEYTTIGHDGFLDYVRAMRAAPSSTPILIGAAMLPFDQDQQPIADAATMRDIFTHMDFYVRHQYNFDAPIAAYASYPARRQIASERVARLREIHDRVAQYTASLGLQRVPAIAVTEWNIFLHEDYQKINRTLEGAVIAGEWFIGLLNLDPQTRVNLAHQFALPGGNLSLIRSQSDHSISPMGYLFQGFSSWRGARVLPVSVSSPQARAYDRDIRYLAAAAAISADGSTVHIAITNNAETETITTTLTLQGFSPVSGRKRTLSAANYDASNDSGKANVTLHETPLSMPVNEIALPPHSVTFIELHAEPTSPRIYLPIVGI